MRHALCSLFSVPLRARATERSGRENIYLPISYDQLRERAIIIDLQGEKIPVVSIHDLIKLKMKAGRKQDLSDVEHLKKILEK